MVLQRFCLVLFIVISALPRLVALVLSEDKEKTIRIFKKGGIPAMTTNQINYAKAKEDVRHNKATEAAKLRDIEIGEANATTQRLAQRETARHNREAEATNWFSTLQTTSETRRHNEEQERINWFDAQSQDRYRFQQVSVAQQQADAATRRAITEWEQLGIARLDAATRARQADVAERQLGINTRHAVVAERQAAVSERQSSVAEYNAATNRMSAGAAQTSAAAAYQNALAANINAQTRQGELAESIRRNTLNWQEEQRHNLASEAISSRQASNAARQANAAESQAQSAQQRASTDSYRAKLDTVDTATNAIKAVSGLAASILSKGRR